MGNVVKKAMKPVKNWNIESRAHKAISKEKRPAAPTFDNVSRQIEIVNKLVPDYKEIASRKDKTLDDNLKKVFVQSVEGKDIDSRNDPDRPLPKDNLAYHPFEYGFYEPDAKKVPVGKMTLRQAIEFITKHNQDPTNYTAESVAKEYKLDAKVAADILEHFRVYNTFKDKPEDSEDTMFMPLSLRSGIVVKHKKEKKERAYDAPELEEKEQQDKENDDFLERKIKELEEEENSQKKKKYLNQQKEQ